MHFRAKSIHMIILENAFGVLNVDLMDKDHVSLRHALLYVGKAISDEYSSNLPVFKSVVFNYKIHSIDSFKKGQIYNVIISSVVNPNQLYVQLVIFVQKSCCNLNINNCHF